MQNETYLSSPGAIKKKRNSLNFLLGNKLVHQQNVRINFSSLT